MNVSVSFFEANLHGSSCFYISAFEFHFQFVDSRRVFPRKDFVVFQDVCDEHFYRNKGPSDCRAGAGTDSEAEPVVV